MRCSRCNNCDDTKFVLTQQTYLVTSIKDGTFLARKRVCLICGYGIDVTA